MLVTEIIRRGALYHGDRIALRFGDESRTFREVDRLSNRIANALKDGLGLAKGSPIALLIEGVGDSKGGVDGTLLYQTFLESGRSRATLVMLADLLDLDPEPGELMDDRPPCETGQAGQEQQRGVVGAMDPESH